MMDSYLKMLDALKERITDDQQLLFSQNPEGGEPVEKVENLKKEIAFLEEVKNTVGKCRTAIEKLYQSKS